MHLLVQDDAKWKRRFLLPRYIFDFARGNPNHILVRSNESGVFELYAYDLLSNKSRKLTSRPSGTFWGTISPDGKDVYYLDDKQGNETGHVVRIPFEGGEGKPQDVTPDLPDYSLVLPSIDGRSSRLGITVPGPDGFESFVVNLSGGSIGKARTISRNRKMSYGPIFSQDGAVSIVTSAERFGGLDFSLTAFDTESGKKLSELADEASKILPSESSPIMGDQRRLAMSNKTGVMRPLVWDPLTGDRKNLDVGTHHGDVIAMDWSPDAQRVLLCQNDKAATQLWLLDLKTSALTKVNHPEGTIENAFFQSDRVLLLAWQDSTHPSQLLSLDVNDPTARPRTLLAPKDVPESHPWRRVSFVSSDGQEIQAWVASPEGTGPFPTILDTHGGPTAAQFNAFSPRSQVWLDHGFAFISVNYRGSTTFGKEFEEKINGDLGHLEVEDMVAARRWLIENMISRSDQIFLTGWSYGGYLTLQAMGLYPELWAGGMAGVAVADWVTEYDDEGEEMRGYDVALLGGTPLEKREAYVKASPITYVDRLAAPLLIIQGRNDIRCPPRQVELYEAKARSLGKNVNVVWFDTGHTGSAGDTKLAVAHHEMMIRWVNEVLSARHA